MKIINNILKALLIIGVIFLGFILQTAVFEHLMLAGVVPNIMIILTSTFGFMRGRKTGALSGMVCGLMLDLYSSSYFGTYALIFMLLGYLNGFFRKLYFGDNLSLPVLVIGASDLIYGFIIYLCFFVTRNKVDISYYFLSVIVPEAVYTVLISLALYFPLYYFNNLLDLIDKRGVRRSA